MPAPEMMMRFTVRALGRLGVPEARTYLLMERNMKCAVGLCGHCMFGASFVDRNGIYAAAGGVLALIVFLIVRPQGLLGRRGFE